MIKEKLYPETHTPEEIRKMLEDNCLKKEKQDVRKYFTESEHLQMRKDFTYQSIQVDKLKAELQEITKGFNARMNPIIEVNTLLKKKIDLTYEEVPGDVFVFDFQEEGMMAYYDDLANLISSRRLAPEERQTNLVSEAGKA